MHKKLLLATVLVSSIHIANATCTPPTTLKCNCAHPIINSEGKLACGSSYCGDKKCMPDGSCCEAEKYCEVGDAKYCCAENQTCDTSSGCVEKKDLATLCANGTGVIISAQNGDKYCEYKKGMSWEDANLWCLSNGMTMPTIYELCPGWDGTTMRANGCPNMSYEIIEDDEIWSATQVPDEEKIYGEETYYYSVNNVFPNYVEMTPIDVGPKYFPICH